MSVKIILSNTFDSAAAGVIRDVVEKRGSGLRNIVLVPDKFTLSVENGLLQKLRADCVFDVEVMSFTRFAAKTMRDKINRCLTPEGSVMLLRQAVSEVRGSLAVYGAAADKQAFPREIYAAVTAMRNGGIFPNDLIAVGGDGEAADKLRDVGVIYKKYMELLENNLSDSSTRLYAFADYLPAMEDIDNINIFLMDFYEFTSPQYEIIDKLVAFAANVTVGLVSAADGAANGRFVPDRALKRLRGICAERNIAPEIIAGEYVLTPQKKQILENTFSYLPVKPVETEGKISVFSAHSEEEEIERIAKIIRRDVIEKEMRYKDFAVVVSDADGYRTVVNKVFSRYDIPYYYDEKVVFSRQPAAKYTLAALRCAATSYDFDEVNAFTKNPMFYGDDDGYREVEKFENYCRAYSLQKKIKSPFSNSAAEKIRRKVTEAVSPFYEVKNATVPQYVKLLRKFAEDNSLRDKCEKISTEGDSAETRAAAQIYDKFNAVLDEMEITENSRLVTLTEFADIVEGVFDNVKIALVPLYYDSVYVGEPEESRYDDVKIMFIAGAIDEKLPRSASQTAVIGFPEEAEMIACGLEPHPTKKETLKNNCFNLIQLMLKPSEKLIVSYPEYFGGNEVKPSRIVGQLTELFCDGGKPLSVNIINDGALDSPRFDDKTRATAYAYKFATVKNGFYTVLSDVSCKNIRPRSMAPYDAMVSLLSPEYKNKIDGLFADDGGKTAISGNLALERGFFSASQAEAYFACPYKQYFRYAVNVKPLSDGTLRTLETGTLAHYVMEKFCCGKYYENFDRDKVKKNISRWIDERLSESDFINFKSGKHRNTFERLKDECLQICEGITGQISQSEFKPYIFEAKIGERAKGAKFNGLRTEIDGKIYHLEGSIDRIDEYGGYFTVVDYKSYAKDLRLSDVYNGTKIQPVLYLSAVSDDAKLKYPAGLLYQPITVGYRADDGGRFRMKGIIINDLKVLHSMDTALGTGKSDYLPVTLKSDGSLSLNVVNAVPDVSLTALKLYAEKLTENAVREMIDGNISPSPVSDACKYCDYKDICGYENDQNVLREKFPAVKDGDFMKLVNGETVCVGEEEDGGEEA